MKIDKLQNNVRNPLGVIAMFVSFAYVSMVVSFTLGIDKLHGTLERLPIIYFLILFPIIILSVFCWLIIGHTWKLYSPAEYSDAEIFSFMSGKEIEKKQKEKVSETKALMPDNNSSSSLHVIQKRYDLIQSKVVEKLGTALNVHFTENVRARLNEINRIEFDAVGQGKYGTYYIECKYLPSKPSQRLLATQSKSLRSKTEFARHRNESYRFFLAIVTDGSFDTDEITTYYRDHNPEVIVYLFTQEELIGQQKE
jgi:hypothetical protein